MISNSNKLVTPRRTAEQEADELRPAVRDLNVHTSFRVLADRVGVSHTALWKLVKGKPMRRSTYQRIRVGLARADGATAFDQFLAGMRGLMDPLSKPDGRKAERAVARALAAWYTDAEERVPRWVQWLARGYRRQSTQRVRRVRAAELQA